MSATPARRCALLVVRRVEEQGAYADRALRAEADRLGLEGRERALAQRLAYGVVQRRMTLDAVIERCSSRPLDRIQGEALHALRLGTYQLLFLDGIAPHAAVEQSVELAKQDAPRAAGFVNAVLRNVARSGADILGEMGDTTPEEAAVRHSHPFWMVRRFWDDLGPDAARALLARDNEPPESALRVNTLRATPDAVRGALAAAGVPAHGDPLLPEALVLDAPHDVHGSPEFAAGQVMPQSRGSMLVARAAAPEPGARVLDLCAAPGAKATHLAALMGNEGRVVAVERHARRAADLVDNCRRLGAGCVSVLEADAGDPHPDAPFDLVLLDPPCSDLGTLESRPDVRWRKTPATIEELARLQARLLRTAADQVAPGGVLVYSTCTISPAENERQIDSLLAERPELALDDLSDRFPSLAHAHDARMLQILPHVHGTDGFFVARMVGSA